MVAQIIEKVALEVAYVMLTCRGYVYAVIDRNYRADYVQGVCMPQSDYQLDPWHDPSRSFGSLDHEYAPFQIQPIMPLCHYACLHFMPHFQPIGNQYLSAPILSP